MSEQEEPIVEEPDREELEASRIADDILVARKTLVDMRSEHAALLLEIEASTKLRQSRSRALTKLREQIRVLDNAASAASMRIRDAYNFLSPAAATPSATATGVFMIPPGQGGMTPVRHGIQGIHGAIQGVQGIQGIQGIHGAIHGAIQGIQGIHGVQGVQAPGVMIMMGPCYSPFYSPQQQFYQAQSY